jgi:hypothetical protein
MVIVVVGACGTVIVVTVVVVLVLVIVMIVAAMEEDVAREGCAECWNGREGTAGPNRGNDDAAAGDGRGVG